MPGVEFHDAAGLPDGSRFFGEAGCGHLGRPRPIVTRRVGLTPRLTEALAQWQSTGELSALTAGTEPSPWMFPPPRGR
jgi:hypothetical protein